VGIGGLFFRSRDPQQLAKWYQLHLGIDPVPTDYGHAGWHQAAGLHDPEGNPIELWEPASAS
jgi:hypothetical protein